MLLNVTNPANVLERLNQLPQKFYLTGSRFFECHRSKSDWDFFTDEGSPLLVQALHKLGFVEARPSIKNYGDLWIMELWEHTTQKIHIQFLPLGKAAAKQVIQQTLKEEGYLRPSIDTWNLLMKLDDVLDCHLHQ